MKPWVEEIIQALEKLGGYAHFTQIVDTVKNLNPELMPLNITGIIQGHLLSQSEETSNNIGDVPFINIGNGIWARRDQAFLQKEIDQPSHLIPIRSLTSPTLDGVVNDQGLVETIIQAVTNLGGYAHLTQIINEVRGLQTRHLGTNLNEIIQELMELNSSESNFIAEIVLFTNI